MTYIVARCLLKNRLQEVGMSQVELAEMVGMTKQQIQNYISGRRLMSIKAAYNIAKALKCSIEDLYDWKVELKE